MSTIAIDWLIVIKSDSQLVRDFDVRDDDNKEYVFIKAKKLNDRVISFSESLLSEIKDRDDVADLNIAVINAARKEFVLSSSC